MRKSAFILLVTGAMLSANANDGLYKNILENSNVDTIMSLPSSSSLYWQIQTGIQKYKVLDDVTPLITGRIFASESSKVESISLKYSKHEVDYCAEKVFGYENVAFTMGLGYLGSDAKENNFDTIKYQRSPYVLLGVMAGTNLTENMLTGLSLKYKGSLDRADMEQSIGIDSNLVWKNWGLILGYEKITYNGLRDNNNLKLQVSYSMKF